MTRFYPPLADTGLWFYAALLSLILGHRLVTPFYVKPVDGVAYGAAALISIVLATHWDDWNGTERAVYAFALAYSLVVTISAFAAILLKDQIDERLSAMAESCRLIAGILGSPRAVFSVVMLFAAYVFHRNNAQEVFWIAIAWAVTVAFSPLEAAADVAGQLVNIALGRAGFATIGTVAGYQTPKIILLHQEMSGEITPGTSILVKDEHLGLKTAIALDYVGRDRRLLLRMIEIGQVKPGEDATTEAIASIPAEAGAAIKKSALIATNAIGERVIAHMENVVGIVAPDSSIEKIAFEVTKATDLEEGRLVETFIGEQPVMYQVITGLTKEEVVAQKNSYGYVRAEARKVGKWEDVTARFLKVSWLPALNTPVFLLPKEAPRRRADEIGHFPGSRFGVRVDDIDALVTHNTAILGILGVGKSMLSIELVERLIAKKVKVVCLDLTNQYAKELRDFWDEERDSESAARLLEAGRKDEGVWKDDPEEGGSLPNLKSAIFDDLKAFLDPGNDWYLKIYNPAAIGATRQESEPRQYKEGNEWKRGAALWSVTPVEVTRIIAEAALDLLHGQMVDHARCCLVLEEAHSLVPEWSSAVSDGDKAATNGTARAILQGRKYGLGCLLITQRTANVTKTILNQCNTIFAMRTFDETGMEFLSNYLGRDYAHALPSLAERHAVFFGRASSCENPVLIRLNDRPEFLAAFRAEHPVKALAPKAKPPEAQPRAEASESTGRPGNRFDDMKDDIPF